MAKKRALGKGMERLMQMHKMGTELSKKSFEDPDYISECPINYIIPNENQPRKTFLEENLKELAESIKINGLLQPILTRKIGENRYQIVAGERRWRASKKAGLEKVPIFVKKLTDKDVLILSLIENVQRQDLTPIEEAKAFHTMILEYSLTQQDVSDAVSRSRATIANILRLLKLPEIVQEMVNNYDITPGHAKILLSLNDNKDIVEFAKKTIKENLSVRALERLIKSKKSSKQNDKNIDKPKIDISKYSNRWNSMFKTKVKIEHKNNNKGKISIEYSSIDELERLTNLINQGE